MSNSINWLAGLLAYCRPGFESDLGAELRAELREHAARNERPAAAVEVTICGEGTVALTADVAEQSDMIEALTQMPVFARQLLALHGEMSVAKHASVAAIEAAIQNAIAAVPQNTDSQFLPELTNAVVEFPDTNDGRALSALAQSLQQRLQTQSQSAVQSDAPRGQRLHVLLIPRLSDDGSAQAITIFIATALRFSPPWPMGIARIRVSSQAPSRSAAKLAEAFTVMLGDSTTARLLKPGMKAVDLGAAPGGWSWWLASKGLKVAAIDNGPLKGAAYKHPQIEHVRTDGFRYRPTQKVEWLVCDMVEQPHKVAQLVAHWLSKGWARNAVFNLKLPMKLRLKCVRECEAIIREAVDPIAARWQLQVKQLYHDREEVTCVVTIKE
jgi:23S rRNA (cytidine2498-2'-O)-methyltransferase